LNYIFTKTKKVIASNSYDKSNLHVILLSPRNFGIHGNVIFDGLFDFLQNYGIRTSWFCANEFGINFKDELSQLIIESSETINTIVFIDPLAAVEFFARYRDLDANWFLSLQSKAHFTLAALLGDIWRPKDQISIFKFRDAVNVFFHMDEYCALKFPTDIYQKMFFYPFGAFSNISKEKTLIESKTDQVFFSGQIRDSDRRWWLVELSSLARKHKFSLDLNTWYKHINAINRADYLKKLSSSTSCLGLSQRGKNHWILPSRSFESLRLSTALIQQEGPDCGAQAHPHGRAPLRLRCGGLQLHGAAERQDCRAQAHAHGRAPLSVRCRRVRLRRRKQLQPHAAQAQQAPRALALRAAAGG
jgi:hypothetical protein